MHVQYTRLEILLERGCGVLVFSIYNIESLQCRGSYCDLSGLSKNVIQVR